jgi:hypothetical protein
MSLGIRFIAIHGRSPGGSPLGAHFFSKVANRRGGLVPAAIVGASFTCGSSKRSASRGHAGEKVEGEIEILKSVFSTARGQSRQALRSVDFYCCCCFRLADAHVGAIHKESLRAWRNGRRNGLKRHECALGNRRCRTAQIRGNLSRGNPEPSPRTREGVETRWAAPKANDRARRTLR